MNVPTIYHMQRNYGNDIEMCRNVALSAKDIHQRYTAFVYATIGRKLGNFSTPLSQSKFTDCRLHSLGRRCFPFSEKDDLEDTVLRSLYIDTSVLTTTSNFTSTFCVHEYCLLNMFVTFCVDMVVYSRDHFFAGSLGKFLLVPNPPTQIDTPDR